jgi:HSP20 family protein
MRWTARSRPSASVGAVLEREHEDKGEGFYRSERNYGRFYRAIPLPEGTSTEGATATFKDGVLEVSLQAPRREEKPAKQIPVQ